MKRNQDGFSAIEALLILIIIAMLGGVGYYVYQSQQETKKSQDNSNKSTQEISTQPEQEEVEQDNTTANWLLHESTGKEYSLRIPDGWALVSLSGTDLYGKRTADIVHKQGTKATVRVIEGGWDGASPFSLYYPKNGEAQTQREGEAKGSFTTASELTVYKYQHVQTTDPEGIGYTKGSTVYNYYFDDKGKNIFVQHYVLSGQQEQTVLVEQAIKTLQVK